MISILSPLVRVSLFMILIITTLASGQNLINNGDFTNGTTNWKLGTYSSNASMSVTAGELNISIIDGGSDIWRVQLLQEDIPQIQGSTYTFSFDAYASGAKEIDAQIEKDGSPWTNYSSTGGQAISTTKQNYTYTYTVTAESNPSARVSFNIGMNGRDLFLDNISIIEGSLVEYTLSTSATNGIILPAGGLYPENTSVEMTAVPDYGFTFNKWLIGADEITTNPTTVIMDMDRLVTAEFAPLTSHSFSTVVIGDGSLSSFQTSYFEGEVVSLTATPLPGSRFVGYTGTYESTTPQLDITIDQDVDLVATFEQVPTYPVTTSIVGSGEFSPLVPSIVEENSSITIAANPIGSYEFTHFVIDGGIETNNPTTITINQATTIVAHFAKITTPLLISLNKPATSSSNEGSSYSASKVVDGDASTRWSSDFSDPQWITIDLEAQFQITTITLDWETAASKAYEIEVSDDNITWTSAYSTTNGNGGTDNITINKLGQYIRLTGTSRTTEWGHSLFTFDVYGLPGVTYDLTVTTAGNGTITPDQGSFGDGEAVTLTTAPDNGWRFVEWTGDFVGTLLNPTIIMDAHKNITAIFEEIPTYLVNYSYTGTGSGSIASSIPGPLFEEGSMVTFTASAANDSRFIQWSNGSTDAVQILTINTPLTLSAEFMAIPRYTLITNTSGLGTGSIDISPIQSDYLEGTLVSLHASAAIGSRFIEWQGALTSTLVDAQLRMDSDQEVTAIFEPIPTYTITTASTGSGTISLSPTGGTYNEGTTVTITAEPDTYWQLDSWGGALSGSTLSQTITIGNNLEVSALFSEIPNQAPFADAGADQYAYPQNLITLDGSNSNDPDSRPQPITYTWSQASGPTIALSDFAVINPTFTPSDIGTYVFDLMVSDGDLNSQVDQVVITIEEEVIEELIFAVNAGGSLFTDDNGIVYESDNNYSGGKTASTTKSISGTTNDILYQSERWGASSYDIPAVSGEYRIEFHFAETYWTTSNKRVFDISAEGTTVINNLDIVNEVGTLTRYDIIVEDIPVTDGTLSIEFHNASVDQPKISGFRVYKTADIFYGNFSVDTKFGSAPLAVQFTDNSSDKTIGWNWDFGDGTTSTTQNPLHTYSTNGVYSISLTITNVQGETVVITKNDLIEISDVNPYEVQADALIAQMTLEEKIGQMIQVEYPSASYSEIRDYGIGSILGGGSWVPGNNTITDWSDAIDGAQDAATHSRLGIPMVFAADMVHGHAKLYGATVLPHNIGLGATNNPDLVYEMGRITKTEGLAAGVPWNFAPCVAVVRDERWGRTNEGFGETPDINSVMGDMQILGMQGDDGDWQIDMAPSIKHYVGDGGTAWGSAPGGLINPGVLYLNDAELRSIHLPPYESAVDIDVASVMVSYSSWHNTENGDERPTHLDGYLINDVLKGELGFKGVVLSDWDGIARAGDGYTAWTVADGINAGIDMVMVPSAWKTFRSALLQAHSNGWVSTNRINDAVKRILLMKYRLDLFENPWVKRELHSQVGSAAHRDLARQAVRESLVLLKNENNALPLSKNEKVVVVGPWASKIGAQSGGWTIDWQGDIDHNIIGTSIYDGMNQLGNNVWYDEYGNNLADADVVVVVVGESPYAESQGDHTYGSSSVYLSQNPHADLVGKVANSGKRIVTVLLSGRPMIINPEYNASDAFIAAWLPGSEGLGIAEVLFGDYNFSGTLPHSWPNSYSQIPINVGDGQTPKFQYGFGLTY
ncbi:MAG: glycoside hydrolase family 3 C-terminal domain-containing protein [Fibrobacterales bacterium]